MVEYLIKSVASFVRFVISTESTTFTFCLFSKFCKGKATAVFIGKQSKIRQFEFPKPVYTNLVMNH